MRFASHAVTFLVIAAAAAPAFSEPTLLECSIEASTPPSSYGKVVILADEEGGLWDKFWVTEISISDYSRTDVKEWWIARSGQREVSIVTAHEFINAQAIIGTDQDQRDISSEARQPYDTAEKFIEGMKRLYSNKAETSIAAIYYLNRATLDLKKVYVGGGGKSEVVATFTCNIGNFHDAISRANEIEGDLNKITDDHNATLKKDVPKESRGLENKL